MLRLAATLCLLLLGADPPPGQDRLPSAADQKLADRWLAERLQILNDTKRSIERAESVGNAARDSRGTEGAAESRAAAVRKIKGGVSGATSGDLPAPRLASPLVVGDIGTLDGYSFRVLKRLGVWEARVGIHRPLTTKEDEQVLRLHTNLPETDVFLIGFDFSKIIDDQECKTTDCFIVRGTRTYTAAIGGTRTLFVIEPYDSSTAETIVRNAVQQYLATEKEREARKAAAMTEWRAEQRRAKAERDAKKYPALLKNARSLIKAKVYASAEKMLRRIIDEAPGTDAAKESQKELDALPAH